MKFKLCVIVLIIITAICAYMYLNNCSVENAEKSDYIQYDPKIHGDLLNPKMSSPLTTMITKIEEVTEPLLSTTITEIEEVAEPLLTEIEEDTEPLLTATITEIEEDTEPLLTATITEIEEDTEPLLTATITEIEEDTEPFVKPKSKRSKRT
jgi:hypothetical protein